MLVYDSCNFSFTLLVQPVVSDAYVSSLHTSRLSLLDECNGGHIVLIQYRGPLFVSLRDEEAPEMYGLICSICYGNELSFRARLGDYGLLARVVVDQSMFSDAYGTPCG